MALLITGATGFVGRHLCAQLTRGRQRVLAMLREPDRQLSELREHVNALGGRAHFIHALKGDLDQPDLGIVDELPEIGGIIHLGARFAWQLNQDAAKRTNVAGSLAVAELAHRHRVRLVFTSGFMLENQEHLRRLGISQDDPQHTDWDQVYRCTGAYEASKLEATFRLRAFARKSGTELVEVQPGTVTGHSKNGELDASQPLYTLMTNLANGRLSMVPGSPSHWLPLVAVDHLAGLIAKAATADSVPSRLLALDPETPNLQGTLAIAANALNRRAPTRHIPIPALALLLRIPGLPKVLNTMPETLHFIQTTRFDTTITDRFLAEQQMPRPPIEDVIAESARYVRTRSLP
ncbi:NAD-dependent epimerase/dehydratase family protein [Natronospirillum operosum]|uniref:NAD-dependent epimerase/dehydratase family protein n=1 Tax=Natronospirillum operosum TaxID=2759953 RepID=A0A4Z0W9M8_9GAMM|nr:SDR family oxidoreductase [Natronospirillum operosum]TGG92843.1 NAD-dependent epimerase/dehydratase family protein [Natronospirillum operosum]